MNVYIVTEAELMGREAYVGVFASKKAAEKYIRNEYPNARESNEFEGYWTYLCKSKNREFLRIIQLQKVHD